MIPRLFRPGIRAALLGVRVLFVLAVSPVVSAQAQTAPTVDEKAFLAENDTAMTRMMNDMAAKPSGDIDRDFVAMMTPHHQGAIDMAVIELRFGKNEALRRIAQEIIVDQMQEIDAMKLAIGDQVTASMPAPTRPEPAPDHMDMQMDMSGGMKK